MGTINETHGHTAVGWQSSEYQAYRNMIRRCYDPNNRKFQTYGARGIIVCERWRHSFKAFLADMGLRPSMDHSLDRINNDGPYEPSNCRWATRQEQGLNTSRQRHRWRWVYPRHGVYLVYITSMNRQFYGGAFASDRMAALAANELARRLHGDDLRFNEVFR